eukprot:scaffold48575_cov343-Isochrysis_galbana.AAC.1
MIPGGAGLRWHTSTHRWPSNTDETGHARQPRGAWAGRSLPELPPSSPSAQPDSAAASTSMAGQAGLELRPSTTASTSARP